MAVDLARRTELQEQVTTAAAAALLSGKNIVISAPTGFGKTNMAIDVFQRLIAERPDFRVLVVQDRQAIGAQNIARANSLGVKDASLSINGEFDPSGQAAYGITKTLYANRHAIGHRDAVWIDECHHATADEEAQHSAIINAVLKINPNAVVMGTSATLERSDKAKLHPALCNGERFHVTYEEAAGCGAIVPPKVTCPEYRLSNGKTVAETVDEILDPNDPSVPAVGIQKALATSRPHDFFDTSIRAWLKANNGTPVPTFAYTNTIKDADLLCAAFQEAGIKAAVVHSDLSPALREKAFADYRAGRVQVLSSVNMLTEGVDVTRTQSLLCLKETTSRSEWIQINGRGARAHTEAGVDKQAYTVIDMGASTYMHGSMDKYRKIENFIAKGPETPTTKYRPWKDLSAGQPHNIKIYGLHDGLRTVFAVRPRNSKRFLLLQKNEICFGRNKATTRLVKPISPKTFTPDEIIEYGRQAVAKRFDVFTTLESRPKGSDHHEIVKRSFAESQNMLKIFSGEQAISQPRERASLSR